MRSKLLALSILCVLCSLPAAAFAAPGPDETAESATYDVTLNSRGDGDLEGQFVFQGDPNRPQNFETGAFDFTLTSVEDTSLPGAAGTGNWLSIDFWFINFWLAVGDTDGGGQVFAYGVAGSTQIFGKAAILDDATLIEGGCYRLYGEIPTVEEPTVPGTPETPTTPEVPETTDETMP